MNCKLTNSSMMYVLARIEASFGDEFVKRMISDLDIKFEKNERWREVVKAYFGDKE